MLSSRAIMKSGDVEHSDRCQTRGEIVETIAGLPIGRVPRGFSSCFWELLSSPDVDSIEW